MFQERLPSAGEVSRTLADILRGPDFQSFDGAPLAQALTRLWDRFWDWIGGMFPEISDAWVEALATVIAAVCLVAVAVAVLRMLPRRSPEPARRDPGDVPPERRTARDWLRIATERARAAEYRDAATALYQGFVLTLDGRGAVDFHPSKTPGEYALEAAAGDGIGEREKAGATTFMRSFQKLAFGHDTPTPSGYRGLERLAGRAGCDVSRDAGVSRGRLGAK